MERKEREKKLEMQRMKGLCGIGTDYSRKALIWSAPFGEGGGGGERRGAEHRME